MVIFKKRWARNFIRDLQVLPGSAFMDSYLMKVPSNIRIQDIVNVAHIDDIQQLFTAPHRHYIEEGSPMYSRATQGDGVYFFPKPYSSGYIACNSERTMPWEEYESENIKDVFAWYLDLIFLQLQFKPKDRRAFKRKDSE